MIFMAALSQCPNYQLLANFCSWMAASHAPLRRRACGP